MGKTRPKSRMQEAVNEINKAFVDLRYSDFTSHAQMERATRALGYLQMVANYCHFDHYDKIRTIDRVVSDDD